MPDTAPSARPDGQYAVVEIMGHRTLIGRVSEADRFGAKFCAIEPIWQDAFLPAVLVGGASIYQLTPCTAEVAFRRQATEPFQLPAAVRETIPAAALPAPARDLSASPEEIACLETVFDAGGTRYLAGLDRDVVSDLCRRQLLTLVEDPDGEPAGDKVTITDAGCAVLAAAEIPF